MPDPLVYSAAVRAPHGASTGHKRECKPLNFTTSSSAATPIGEHDDGDYVTFVATVDCFLRVGGSGIGDATTDDYPLNAKQEYMFMLVTGESHFRVIGSENGTIKRYISSGP